MSEKKVTWANPAPAGMIALAVACFAFYAILNGHVGGPAQALLGCWLMGGFAVQLCVGLIELKSGSIIGGNVFLFFSAFFMLTSGLEQLFSFFAPIYHWLPATASPLGSIDGWAWLVLAIGLTTWTAAYLKSPWSLFILIVALDIAAFILAFTFLGMIDQPGLGGVFLLIAGIFGLYTGCGIVLNSAFDKNIIPMGSIMK